jgi:predicted permease
MNLFLQQLQFSVSVTGPICLMLFLGIYFRRSRLIDDHFIEVASRLVFKVTLPALLFLSIMESNHDLASSSRFLLYGLLSHFSFFIFTNIVVRYFFRQTADQGVIIQGAFRGNMAIIALAFVVNAYHNLGLVTAAPYVAVITLLYNIEAVYTLTPKGGQTGFHALGALLKTLTKNPLIIAIILGVVFAQLAIPLPEIASKAGHYFANMTLPLALICAGGSLDLRELRHNQFSAWFATSFKLIACPLLITLGALMIGFRGIELGIIFLTSSSPAASASYVMARAMGGNAVLAANIIVLTTLLSLLTTTLGIFILSSLSLI